MNIDALQSLDGHTFEGLVADLLRAMGLRVERSKLSADGGIDAIAYCDKPLLKGKYIVQCKRQKAPVGEPVLRDLYGTVMSERAAKGILVTTSHFTQSAHRFAQGKPIELISGSELIELLQEKGLLDVVDSQGITIPPQWDHLVYQLNRMLRPIWDEINDIERGYVPPPVARSVDLVSYVKEVTKALMSFLTTLECIVNISNDLIHGANEGYLEPEDTKRKMALMAKHLRTLKDLWISTRQMQPPSIADSHHKACVEFTHDALLYACSLPGILQEKVDAIRAGDLSAIETTEVVFDCSPYMDRINKEGEPLLRRLKQQARQGQGCLSVLVLPVIGMAILFCAWL